MRKVLAVAVVSLLVVPMLFVGTSSAHVRRIDTRLSIGSSPSGTRVLVFGKLKPNRCRLGQMVTLYEAGPGSDQALGSDRIDGDGEYGIRFNPSDNVRVYTRVGPAFIEQSYEHTHKCKGDRSPKIVVNA